MQGSGGGSSAGDGQLCGVGAAHTGNRLPYHGSPGLRSGAGFGPARFWSDCPPPGGPCWARLTDHGQAQPGCPLRRLSTTACMEPGCRTTSVASGPVRKGWVRSGKQHNAAAAAAVFPGKVGLMQCSTACQMVRQAHPEALLRMMWRTHACCACKRCRVLLRRVSSLCARHPAAAGGLCCMAPAMLEPVNAPLLLTAAEGNGWAQFGQLSSKAGVGVASTKLQPGAKKQARGGHRARLR